MGREIERKFLVHGSPWRGTAGVRICQGYLSVDPERTVRIRVAGDAAWITIKAGISAADRAEYEYSIPLADAEVMLHRVCLRPWIEKTRHRIIHLGQPWDIDVFHGAHEGLVLAEAELPEPDHPLTLPDWVGREVTQDPAFTNARLAQVS